MTTDSENYPPHDESIISLPQLIERVRDPSHSFLFLDEVSLSCLGDYEGIDDYAEVYEEYLDAIKANRNLTKIEVYGFFNGEEKGTLFPIINPLLRHLPGLEAISMNAVSSTPIEMSVFKDAARFTHVQVLHHVFQNAEGFADDTRVYEWNPDLEVFEYVNRMYGSVNAMIGPVLLSLPFPSKLRESKFLDDADRRDYAWADEMARPFTEPELTRLVEIVQVSSLVQLTLHDIRFSSMEECSQFARGLAASPAKDLCLLLYTPDAANYRDVVSALAAMPHLTSLDAIFHLDEWEANEETLGLFSIPVGDIVRGAPGMKSLKIGQGWKPWDNEQCRDLAEALQTRSCGLEALDLSNDLLSETEIAGVATIMSSFTGLSSSIQEFAVAMAPSDANNPHDVWLSTLPKTTALRSLRISNKNLPALTDFQEERLLGIVSGWFYLTSGFATHCLRKDCCERLETLVRLNNAGRHYLTFPTRSKADGVEVLIKVRDHLNDVYTHLLENPCLCDRGVATPAGQAASPLRKKPRHL